MATDGRQLDDWRTAREIADPDHPAADALQFCVGCGQWAPHWMDEDGSYSCIPCAEADQQDIREALEEEGL